MPERPAATPARDPSPSFRAATARRSRSRPRGGSPAPSSHLRDDHDPIAAVTVGGRNGIGKRATLGCREERQRLEPAPEPGRCVGPGRRGGGETPARGALDRDQADRFAVTRRGAEQRRDAQRRGPRRRLIAREQQGLAVARLFEDPLQRAPGLSGRAAETEAWRVVLEVDGQRRQRQVVDRVQRVGGFTRTRAALPVSARLVSNACVARHSSGEPAWQGDSDTSRASAGRALRATSCAAVNASLTGRLKRRACRHSSGCVASAVADRRRSPWRREAHAASSAQASASSPREATWPTAAAPSPDTRSRPSPVAAIVSEPRATL